MINEDLTNNNKKPIGKKGKKFEKTIKESADYYDLFFLKLQDNLKFSGKVEGARFSQKSPYDSVVFIKNTLFCIEMKSTKGTSLSIGKNKMIKDHQIEELSKANAHNNVFGGFLIQFAERDTKSTHREEEVYYVEIESFNEYFSNCDKKSISYEDCKKIGYMIDKINIGVRKPKYIYNLLNLVDIVI